MLTIRAEIKKGEQKSDGTYNVKLRFTHQRKVRRLSTSLFVRPEDLTKSLSFKNGTPIKNDIDNLVNEYRMRCNKLPIDIEGYTLDEIMGELEAEEKRKQTIDFIQFCTLWIKETDVKGKGNYQSALSAFKAYLNTDTLPTSRLTSSLLKGFIEFLQKRADEREKSLVKAGKRVPPDRTVSQYLGSIRHLFNEAKKKYNDYDRNIIVIGNSPFESMKVPKQRATRKRAISPELLKAMWKIPYKNTIRGRSKTCPIDFAKDTFIMSFCLMGMNSVDMFNVTEIQNNRLIYYRTKTKDRRSDHARMEVVIPNFIKPLITKYRDDTGQRVFRFYKHFSNYRTFNAAINRGLKFIGDELSIDDLEFYAARHSWATIALNKCKIDKYTVHAALNHVDESMRVTDIYIERDFVNENKANAKVVKYVFGK